MNSTTLSEETATYRIALEGTDLTFACRADDTLLRASLRAGIGLSYECNAGSCGSCKVRLIQGQLHDLFPLATGIKTRDRERGFELACQSTPRTDCTIKARLDESCTPCHRPQRQLAHLQTVRHLTHDIREFTFTTGSKANFLPGQYAMLQLKGFDSPRAYSMSNIPNADGQWQFMVRQTPEGVVSRALFELPLGSEVELDGPFGNAYLRPDSPRDIVCIAGGSGIAPMMSILKAASLHTPDAAKKAWLFHGGRGPEDIPHLKELCAPHVEIAQNLSWCPVVSDTVSGQATQWTGRTGFVHEMLSSQLNHPLAEYEYYFAGPPPMIEATVRLLAIEHKVPQSQMHFDRFF